MIDVDHFKSFNDRNGHQAGDECLRRVGHAIRSAIRPGDLAARYGGEEFAVLLSGIGEGDADIVAERIRAGIPALRMDNGGTGCGVVTISAGVAALMTRGVAVETPTAALLTRADRAPYRAKESGRNRVCRAARLPRRDRARLFAA